MRRWPIVRTRTGSMQSYQRRSPPILPCALVATRADAAAAAADDYDGGGGGAGAAAGATVGAGAADGCVSVRERVCECVSVCLLLCQRMAAVSPVSRPAEVAGFIKRHSIEIEHQLEARQHALRGVGVGSDRTRLIQAFGQGCRRLGL